MECDIASCEYCSSGGKCVKYDDGHCDRYPCGEGDGDCDPNQCSSPFVCEESYFLQYHPFLVSCKDIDTSEVCQYSGTM